MAGSPHTLKAAQRMIDRYGEDALRQVEWRIEELNQSGQEMSDACLLWCQVREAIVALIQAPPHGLKQ